jgi:WD40 repeat protein
MLRPAVLLLLLAAPVAAQDLPPGAVARMGEARFRAGGPIYDFGLSPDGKQFFTRTPGTEASLVTVWDSASGLPVRETRVTSQLLRGAVWGNGGAFVVAIRAEPGPNFEKAGTIEPDDFLVWPFTDAKAKPPREVPTNLDFSRWATLRVARPKGRAEYGLFQLAANGTRAAGLLKKPNDTFEIRVFDLAPADTSAKLNRFGTIDLGAQPIDTFRVSADCAKVVTFRRTKPHGWTATVWDARTGKPREPVVVNDVGTLLPDASALIVRSGDEKEWGFDLLALEDAKRTPLVRWPDKPQREGEELRDEHEVGASAFAPDGRTVALAVGPHTHVLDYKACKELGRLEGHAGDVCGVRWSANGERLATADRNGLVRFWNPVTLRPVEAPTGHRAAVEHAELSPNGKLLLTWARDNTVRLWDASTGRELRAFADVRGPARPTFTPDGTAVLYPTERALISRDLQTGLEIPLPGALKGLKPRNAVFAQTGTALLTYCPPHDPLDHAVWDWPNGKKRCDLVGAFDSECVPGFSPDGSVVFLDANTEHRFDARTGKRLEPEWKDLARRTPILALRPSPRLLLHSEAKGGPCVTVAGTGAAVSRFRFAVVSTDDETSTGLDAIAVSPTGGQFAWTWGLGASDVQLSESASCTVRRVLRGHRGATNVLGFTPDGKLLTAGGDHTVLVWDVRPQGVPLPPELKAETNAAILWDALATAKSEPAYLVMARLAREPAAAVKFARTKLKPVLEATAETDSARLADARAVELLEALATPAALALLKELARGEPSAFRTQEARRALERRAALRP